MVAGLDISVRRREAFEWLSVGSALGAGGIGVLVGGTAAALLLGNWEFFWFFLLYGTTFGALGSAVGIGAYVTGKGKRPRRRKPLH